MTDVREFDAAYHLDNPKVIAAYLEEAFETGDTAYIAHAFKTVARARGMEELAARLGMSRSGLYKALGPEGNPSFSTMLQLLSSLGMGVSVRPQQPVPDRASIRWKQTTAGIRLRAASAPPVSSALRSARKAPCGRH